MKNLTSVLIGLALSSFVVSVSAQEAKPYKEGQVTALTYVKTKPGKFDEYMKYLDTNYKAEMEAFKQAGLVVSYSVYSANPRSASEPDLVLAITYANMAALDKTDEVDSISAKVAGSRATQNKGYADREAVREILGGELVRELILK